MKKDIYKLRIFLFSLLGLTVLILIYKAIVPFGKIIYAFNPCGNSFIISKIKPAERVEDPRRNKILGLPLGNCAQKITGDPVYFNLETQRGFDRAKITLEYRRLKNKIIEIGVLADKERHYRLQPLENQIIDNLAWRKIEQDGVILLQREENYNSVDEFFNNPPNKEKVLTYHYDLPAEEKINNYGNLLASSKAFSAGSVRPLRGAYQFYTYIGGEDFDFNFIFTNLKTNDKDDNIKIVVYYKNSAVEQKEIKNEGEISIKLPGPPDGFYKIAISASDDVITEKIATTQRILSFINRVWLAGTPEPGLINLTTDSSEIFARTINPNSLQKILVRDKILKLDETYQQFSQVAEMPITNIRLAKDDVIIAGDGVFSFSNEAFYNPDYKKVNKNTDVDRQGIGYIITSYEPRDFEDGWQVRTVDFDLTKAYRYEGVYGFIISVPGLLVEDEINDWVEIGEIWIELEGRTLLNKILNIEY
ncbi:hypothetical protein COT99_01615 [Candidatus Falkowbacteria bacterium CG10_big_fil_rev_8_21_14_0_10_43_10]|uniref:Uncharacterized protein n=1 Tax=Candidatus Falkowbacteria bacterium CG10_big_fil_rev_8_21_14_0_10_43_10 TaxID=1974567 RepID=A0A2H0V2G0_9BACT|nr:MAG: hypothetical protein COT99_01615 [Candidatus Falkowbacteria bacterium CG10_big_fil_rev_8_21_14_0_10_43_10]